MIMHYPNIGLLKKLIMEYYKNMEYKNKKTRRPQSEHSWAHLPIQYHTFTKKKKKNTQSHISQHFCVCVCVCTNLSEAVQLRNMASGSRQWSRRLIGALLVRRLSVQMGCDLSSAQQHNCTQPDLPSLVSITLSCHFSVSQSVTHSLTSSPFLRYSGAQKLFKKKYYKVYSFSFSCCSKAVRLTFFCETRFFFFLMKQKPLCKTWKTFIYF